MRTCAPHRSSAGEAVATHGHFISQAALTGESFPVEKFEPTVSVTAALDPANALGRPNLCFMGTNLVSGTATALVSITGARTQFGSLASSVVKTWYIRRFHAWL